MHHAKNRGNKQIPLAILLTILAQSCVTLCLNHVGRVTRLCNDFCHIFFMVAYKRSYMHAYMRSAAPLSRVSLVKWRRSSSRQLEFTFVVASYPALIL